MDMLDLLTLELLNTKLEILTLILEMSRVELLCTWLLKFYLGETILFLLTSILLVLWFMNLYLEKDHLKEKIELKLENK